MQRLPIELSCVNILLSAEKVHLSVLTKMVQVHSIRTVFDRCVYGSQNEDTHIYTVTLLDQSNILERLSSVTVA